MPKFHILNEKGKYYAQAKKGFAFENYSETIYWTPDKRRAFDFEKEDVAMGVCLHLNISNPKNVYIVKTFGTP